MRRACKYIYVKKCVHAHLLDSKPSPATTVYMSYINVLRKQDKWLAERQSLLLKCAHIYSADFGRIEIKNLWKNSY